MSQQLGAQRREAPWPIIASITSLARASSVGELLADYPYLEREGISEALRYAAWRAEEREIELPRR